MHNGIEIQTITLSTGETYTPEKDKPPVYPCTTCEKKRECALSLGLCAAYMDYEHMNAIYRTTVF